MIFAGSPLGARLAALALVAAVAVALAVEGGPEPPPVDAVGYDGRSPRLPAAGGERLLIELERAPLAKLVAARREAGLPISPPAQRRYLRSLRREAFSLRGSLRAKGIAVRHVRPLGRLWNGFAATVPASRIARLAAAGLRLRSVRRFYPASVRGAALPRPGRARPVGGRSPPPRLALIDSGVDYGHPGLGGGIGRGRPVAGGYDAVGRDRDPRPAGRLRHAESHGTEMAGVLIGPGGAARGERLFAIRAAAVGTDPATGGPAELATTDTLLAGLERAVDPDGDGSLGDALPVALIGLSSPFAGFERSPEARAIEAASRVGTLVVAPAGNEGSSLGPSGTIGSPGAAPAALTAGALAAAGVARAAEVLIRAPGPGERAVPGRETMAAALLAGAPPRRRLRLVALARRSPHGGAAPADYFGPGGASRVAGRAVALRRGASPLAQAAAAAAAGAAAVLLCDPGGEVPLPPLGSAAVPIPVAGLSGGAAGRALERAREAGATLAVAAGAPPRPRPARRAAAFSSRGPTFDGRPKPDLAGPGAAPTTVAGGGYAVAGGTSVAAAQVAAVAVALRARRPRLDPAAAAELLRRTARALAGPRTATGAGTGDLAAALAAPPPAAGAAPPAATPLAAPPPPPLSSLRLRRRRGAVAGVAFDAGSVRRDRRRLAVSVEPLARLSLELIDGSGAVVRTLTPPGGAEQLLPARYAYTLPRSTLAGLPAGRYAFRARAEGRPGAAIVTRRSARFGLGGR